jgi:hypothetical protein
LAVGTTAVNKAPTADWRVSWCSAWARIRRISRKIPPALRSSRRRTLRNPPTPVSAPPLRRFGRHGRHVREQLFVVRDQFFDFADAQTPWAVDQCDHVRRFRHGPRGSLAGLCGFRRTRHQGRAVAPPPRRLCNSAPEDGSGPKLVSIPPIAATDFTGCGSPFTSGADAQFECTQRDASGASARPRGKCRRERE